MSHLNGWPALARLWMKSRMRLVASRSGRWAPMHCVLVACQRLNIGWERGGLSH